MPSCLSSTANDRDPEQPAQLSTADVGERQQLLYWVFCVRLRLAAVGQFKQPPPPSARQILGNHLLMNSENKCVMTYGSVVRESGARRFWCSEWGFGSEESRCSKDVCLSTYGNILLPCEQKLIFIPERVVETFWGHLLPRADSAPTGDDDIPPLRSRVCGSSFSWNKLNSINPAELHSQLSKHRRQAGHCCTDESGNDITLEARSNSWLQKSQQ